MLKNHVNAKVAYDSLEREDEGVSICMESTQMEVLEKIRNWAQDKDGPPVCWLYGPAGSGKSDIPIFIFVHFHTASFLARAQSFGELFQNVCVIKLAFWVLFTPNWEGTTQRMSIKSGNEDNNNNTGCSPPSLSMWSHCDAGHLQEEGDQRTVSGA
jgi:hypothetical protein